MPIYEFGCKCGQRVELNLPMSESGSHPECPMCEEAMTRRFSPVAAIIPQTGRDKVLANLNSKDNGIGNYPHHKAAMWKGLNQTSPVIGRGFG